MLSFRATGATTRRRRTILSALPVVLAVAIAYEQSIPVAVSATLPDPCRGVGGCTESRYRSYEVVNVFPHDAAAYTQGLVYRDGYLLEGTGQYGRSELRRIEIETGRVVQRVALPSEFFGEGIAVLGGRIFQLTWLSNVGFVHDADSFERLGEFRYPTDGWGLTADGENLIMSDGSANLYFLDPGTAARRKTLPVFDDSGAVDQLNELELIDGLIWANIWHSDDIVMISPASGEVVGHLDLSSLLAGERPASPEAVLNGIAHDADNDRLFVTGKLWPKMFEIRLIDDAD